MTRAENKADRLLQIEAMLLAHPEGLTQAEIARRLDVNRSTVNRYFRDMPIQFPYYESEDGRLFIDRQSYLVNVRFGLHEALAVHLASRLLATRMDRQNPHAASALRKLGLALERLAPRISHHVQQSADVMDEAAQRHDPVYLQSLERLTLAWAEQRKAQVWHRSEKMGKVFEYLFSPYFIEPYAVGQTTMLIGLSDPPGKLRTLKIERIERVELTHETYEIPADFDPRNLLADAWGIWYTESEPVEVVLKFHPRVARRVQETRWHRSEQERELPDGSIEWRAKVAEVQEMIPWIRGWGADCEVIEPKELRESLVKEAKLLARVYGLADRMGEQDSTLRKPLRLWGKTERNNPDPEAFHPALFHMLDAGNVARELLSDKASLRWRKVLADVLGADADMLADWLPWFVAMHDIGKIAEAFQEQNEVQKKRLVGEGVPFKQNGWQGKPHHSNVSEIFILAIADDLSFPDGLRETWQAVVSGHHGWFCGNEMRGQTARSLQVEAAEWQKWRIEASELLKSVLLRQPPVQWPAPSNISAASMALTGFTILCDWLGFGREFKMQPEMTWSDYVKKSAARARRVVDTIGFQQPSQSQSPTAFVELFSDPNLQPPRPLQTAIDVIPADVLAAPCLAIIEAPTGEGKTEAALALAHRLAQAHGTDEFYYALPTMATSNQMFGRLKTHLVHRLGFPDGSIQLIHGQAFLMEDDRLESALNLGEATDWRAAQNWIGADKRKAILMPFGVGTIDQAELAALHVRYVALRLAGLAGKVVILDEVHAYDTYMTTIVEMLLQWLSALGTSVILLSATLPKAQRRKLAQAYGVNLEPVDGRLDKYPSLFVANRAGIPHCAQPVASQPDRRIALDKSLNFSDDEPEAKAKWLLKAVEHDGCACWITNTVERAQKLFEQLDKLPSPEISLMLMHASLPLDERLKREEELTDLYGREGKRPCKGIVIGTQVLEQSLDLDFDIMVSDLAPIDFLLQRAGRLHRHQRGERGQPHLYLNVRTVDSKLELAETDTWIYDEYLLRLTWAALETKPEIILPEDYRPLIESVYAAPEPAQDSPLRQVWEQMVRDRKSARAEADGRLIPECSADYSFRVELTNRKQFDDENSAGYLAARTRREAESITIIPLERTGNLVLFVTAEGETVEINTNQVASRKVERQILRRMVRVSRKAALFALKQYRTEEKAVPLFADSPHLSEYLPLWLTNGQKSLPQGNDTIHLRLDPKLGLVIGKEKGAKG